jgi:hypothetical protein
MDDLYKEFERYAQTCRGANSNGVIWIDKKLPSLQ